MFGPQGSRIAAFAVALVAVTVASTSFAQTFALETGANSLVDSFITIATPIAVLFVMVLGVVALTGRISWGWPVSVLVGIGVIFGAGQLVEWTRGLFAV